MWTTCLVRNRPWDEALNLNMTLKVKRPSKSELINGVEQAPNGIPRRRGGLEGEGRGVYERKKRKDAVKAFLHRFIHSRSEQTTARMVECLCNTMASAVIGAREIAP